MDRDSMAGDAVADRDGPGGASASGDGGGGGSGGGGGGSGGGGGGGGSGGRGWRHFRYAVADGVATIVLDRPARLNALTFAVYADLRDLFTGLAHGSDVRCVVITGEGRGFCSGGDVEEIIGELVGMDARGLLAFTRMTGAVVRAMRECPVPVIAAVNGVAAGAGAVIALAADFRLCAQTASFAFLFTKVGLAGADMGAAYLLPRVIGFGRATELLMLGDPVTAAAAERIGLANRVVGDADLLAEAGRLAQRLAAGPALAYANTKLLLTRELDLDLAGAIELEAVTQAMLMTTRDHAEFKQAFTQRRPPRWQGR